MVLKGLRPTSAGNRSHMEPQKTMPWLPRMIADADGFCHHYRMHKAKIKNAWFWLLVLLAALAAPVGPALAEGLLTPQQATEMIRKSRASYDKVKDYTAVFYRLAADDGELEPPATFEMKFRKPGQIYLKSIHGEAKGREILFNPLEDKETLWVHNGSFPRITVCLDPKGSLATDCVGHTVHDSGFGFVLKMMEDTIALALKNPQDEVRFADLGLWEIFGRPSQCLTAEMPDDPSRGYYGRRAKICFDQETWLPCKVTIWDHQDRLREDYGYADVHLNVGLTDQDFDPENPEYHF